MSPGTQIFRPVSRGSGRTVIFQPPAVSEEWPEEILSFFFSSPLSGSGSGSDRTLPPKAFSMSPVRLRESAGSKTEVSESA